MDILFLALLAAYIIYKLYLTLGEERNLSQEVSLDSLSQKGQMKDATIKTLHDSLSDEDKIRLVDKSFDAKSFLYNSEKAVGLIFESFAKGDTSVISDLSEIAILRRFAFIISEIEDKKLEAHISDLKLKDTKLNKVIIHKNFAELCVKYKAECEMHLSEKGKVIAGNKNKLHKFTLDASFVRDLKSKDPTWKLSKINFIPFEKELNV